MCITHSITPAESIINIDIADNTEPSIIPMGGIYNEHNANAKLIPINTKNFISFIYFIDT